MLRLLSVSAIACAGLALIAGCGGGDDTGNRPASTAATTASVTTATTPATTAPAAWNPEDALFTLADMPTGWVKDQDSDDSGALCDAHVFDSAQDDAKVTYSQQGQLPTLNERVGVFTASGARRSLQEAKATYDACQTHDRDGLKWTVSPVSFPALGDESIAYLATTEQDGIRLSALFTVIRSGDGLLGVVYGDFASVDTATVEDYARQALARLRAIQG